MCENELNIGEQINTMCKHGGNHVKPVEDMQICPNGLKYVQMHVESGEMPPQQCEPCLIEWLCGEPVEMCMNPEDAKQWHVQCVQPSTFWVEYIEYVLNNPHT